MIFPILRGLGAVGRGVEAVSIPLVVDTDVMVDFLRVHPKAVALVKRHSAQIILCSMVVAELYAGVRNDEELEALDSLISLFRVVPISLEPGRAGGLYRRDYGKTYGVGLTDTIIAATVEAEGAELKTLNTRHYPMIGGLKPAYSR